MATRRSGKSYLWATWLAKALAGDQVRTCFYSPWFKAHFKYEKFEEQATDLARWNREHTRLMDARRRELEEDGWTVFVENDNAFKLEGQVAIVAGKMDLVAVKDDQVLVIDGKTGQERDSDLWQMFVYLFALPKTRPELGSSLVGEVVYKRGGTITLTTEDLTPERLDEIVRVIRLIGGDEAPPKRPSRDECRFCNVGPKDCPERVMESRPVAVGEF